MANRKKEIKAIRVNQKTREVIVYAKSIDNEQQEKEIKMYNDMGYKVVMLDKEKPTTRAKTSISKKDMEMYLKGKIDNKIYNDLLEHLKSKENFLKTKSWLKEELKKNAKKTGKKYIPFNTIIAVEKANDKITTGVNAREYEEQNKLAETIEQEETSENK